MKFDWRTKLKNSRFVNWKWYFQLFVMLLSGITLINAFFNGILKEQWYFESNNLYQPTRLINYDILLSFFSVQVSIITTVYLLIVVINYKNVNSNINTQRTRNIVLNWNLLDFMIFWIGIIGFKNTIAGQLPYLTKTQIFSTVITHFIVPLLLLFIYLFESGNNKYEIKKFYKNIKELFWVYSYPFFYTLFVLMRAQIYLKDKNIDNFIYPYEFLDFTTPYLGNSKIGYLILIWIIFVIWLTLNHLIILLINNLIFKIKNKKKEKIVTSN
ncbi:hypothetical protein [Mycoplasma mycoides]|uniref:hypothetical protein n=1 Tax=Mycoplasma mycoides TaxID=2102 RepID=UPI00223ED29E|nr:hypothetical protein [Mycoplasma mycoides]QVK04862.1 hypothetical protein I7640_02270 [Mycoplasma mycoides subsp. capri]